MQKENARFLFMFSAEATAELEAGNVSLSSGGLRKSDGTILELAKPVFIDPADIAKIPNRTEDEYLVSKIGAINSKQDQIILNDQALTQIAWMNYAVNCRTYELTYQGFQAVIERLDTISTQLNRLQERLERREFNNMTKMYSKCKGNLKTMAALMETKSFNIGDSAAHFEQMITAVQTHFEQLYSDLNNEKQSLQLALESIVFLIEPYCYVIRRYSALYFYENGGYPANYDAWTAIVNCIIADSRLKKRMEYFLRVNSELNLEEILIARNKAMFNLQGIIAQIDFDHRYALCHTKEQYLSIDKQLEDKIVANDYKVVDGHMLIELE